MDNEMKRLAIEAGQIMATNKLKYAKGNLLDLAEAGEFDIVVQGCNCFNTMGGGIAREIRERYPIAAWTDAQTKRGDYTKLGTWTESDAGDEVDLNTFGITNKRPSERRFKIINAYTQYEMSNGQDVFEYTAFDLIMQKLCYIYKDARIGLPFIGMGLANGNKDVILRIIHRYAEIHKGTITLVEFK